MIPATTSLTEHDTLGGEEVEFSIGDARWVMRTQADLYSNRELAVVREYSTNARDAMIEAGKADEPIKVTLPSTLNPQFVVEDFGIGMSTDTLRNVYTKFGTSSKRDSNDFNGILGYGCKSALAYAHQFQVSSIKDGYRTDAIALRREDWSIVLKIVATTKTLEPNGTRVAVPVHNVEEFATKARDFFRFWLPGTVLVNGVEPAHEVGDRIHDDLYFSAEPGVSRVVMGGVAYRIANPDALFRSSALRNVSFVAYVNNGAVEFTPSREDLKYTQKTKDALAEVISETEKNIISEAQARIENAPDHPTAYAEWSRWRKNLGRDLFKDLVYKGDKLQDSFEIFATEWYPGRSRYTTETLGARQYNYNEQKWENKPGKLSVNLDDVLVVCEHGLKSTELQPYPSSGQKQKIRLWIKLNNKTFRKIVFTKSKAKEIGNIWTNKSNFIDWETLKAQLPTPPKSTGGGGSWNSGRPKGSWDYYEISVNSDGRTVVKDLYAKPIPDKVDLYYLTVAQTKRYHGWRGLPARMKMKSGVIIRVPENRLDKFLRDNPKVIQFMKYVKDNTNLDGAGLITPEAKVLLEMGDRSASFFENFNMVGLDDPRFAEMKKTIDKGRADMVAYDSAWQQARACGLGAEFKVHSVLSGGWSNIHDVIKDYPLVEYALLRGTNVPDAYAKDFHIYMNAKYNEDIKKRK